MLRTAISVAAHPLALLKPSSSMSLLGLGTGRHRDHAGRTLETAGRSKESGRRSISRVASSRQAASGSGASEQSDVSSPIQATVGLDTICWDSRSSAGIGVLSLVVLALRPEF